MASPLRLSSSTSWSLESPLRLFQLISTTSFSLKLIRLLQTLNLYLSRFMLVFLLPSCMMRRASVSSSLWARSALSGQFRIFLPPGRCMLPSVAPTGLNQARGRGRGWASSVRIPFQLVPGTEVGVGALPVDCTDSSLTWKNMIIFTDLGNCACRE